LLIGASTSADAAIVPTIPLATSANYAVLGGQSVNNTGPSILNGSLGVWPGTSIVGFPPGQVLPPGTTDATNAVAQQAQSDLTAAYLAAAGRPLNATQPADLSGLTLVGGVYAGPSKSPLSLNGTLTLDGAGDPNSVFIFQTNSTLITGSSSTVTLINGAQECNVFWQVGSSATLGTGSVFAGNILALTSISVTTGVTVHGRSPRSQRFVHARHRHVHPPDLRGRNGHASIHGPGGRHRPGWRHRSHHSQPWFTDGNDHEPRPLLPPARCNHHRDCPTEDGA
jgi:hypothetical protein